MLSKILIFLAQIVFFRAFMSRSTAQRFGHRGRNMWAFSISTPIISGHAPFNDETCEAAKDVGGFDGGATHLEASNSTSWLHF